LAWALGRFGACLFVPAPPLFAPTQIAPTYSPTTDARTLTTPSSPRLPPSFSLSPPPPFSALPFHIRAHPRACAGCATCRCAPWQLCRFVRGSRSSCGTEPRKLRLPLPLRPRWRDTSMWLAMRPRWVAGVHCTTWHSRNRCVALDCVPPNMPIMSSYRNPGRAPLRPDVQHAQHP